MSESNEPKPVACQMPLGHDHAVVNKLTVDLARHQRFAEALGVVGSLEEMTERGQLVGTLRGELADLRSQLSTADQRVQELEKALLSGTGSVARSRNEGGIVRRRSQHPDDVCVCGGLRADHVGQRPNRRCTHLGWRKVGLVNLCSCKAFKLKNPVEP